MSTFMNTDPKAFSGVWVFCEQRQGKMMPTTFELISEGRKLADELGVQLNECADETVRAISNSDAFKAMPNYPADGCIQTIDGVVTLKVADFPF
mgnify:CR=1 FL=1